MTNITQLRDQRGFALIDLLFVIAVLGTLCSIALPGMMRARAQAGIVGALGTLRVINSAQLSYAITCGSGFYAPDLVALGTKPPGSTTAFVPSDLGGAVAVKKSNFLIQLSGTVNPSSPASCNGVGAGLGAQAYRAGADPLDPVAGRYFATNASGTIYEATMSLYATMPDAAPPVGGTPVQ